MTLKKKMGASLLLVGTVASIALADTPSKPHNFNSGDVISAAEMNENFDGLYDGLNGSEAMDIELQGRMQMQRADGSRSAYVGTGNAGSGMFWSYWPSSDNRSL